ncbi:MFS transporter [Nakamurella endophytica]|uniref:MFS transporter n=1 Tax=Nakamurella endophytica TaxID=1748367 RepID=UPI001E397F2F|nr:MFS transporter [Nakamurella endophytica]
MPTAVPGRAQAVSAAVPGRAPAVPVRVSGRSWLVWGAGAGVYVLAVFHRSSLGVAGPLATQRLSLSASQLAGFVMLQLGVYALMQVPTGILVDRFGPRRMLLAATLTMGTAQILFSLVHSYAPALLARGLLGCGDAMTYISVLRLVAGWFPARRYAAVTSFSSLMGSVGNLVATIPLTGVLHGLGWTPTFAIAGGLSLLYALVLLRPATQAPFREAGERAATGPVGGRRVWDEVRAAWRLPAGRLGFWVHLTTMGCPTVFSVLWGYPYLTQALGFAPALASSLVLLFVVGGVVANLVIGQVLGRRPEVRTPLAIAVSVACLMGWLVLILWPAGRPPLPVVVAVVVVLSVGGPASSVAFMLARDYNPRHRISTATGLVNIGGFCGAVVGTFLVGRILDWVEPGRAVHTAAAYRIAFCALVAVTVVGLVRMVTWWLRSRAAVLLAQARGESTPVRLHRLRFELVDQAELVAEARRAGRATVGAPTGRPAAAPSGDEGAGRPGDR